MHHPVAARRLLLGPRALLVFALALPACRAQPPAPDPEAGSMTPAPTVSRDLGDGLIVEDLILGTGEECPSNADITMNFTAALAGGPLYDSSAMRGRPLSFALSSPGLIRGLKLGIPGMKPGGSRRIRIPWALGYGASGRDPVPPKTDLVFEIQLLSWTPADPARQGRPAGAARPR